jgi:hypothetical protein
LAVSGNEDGDALTPPLSLSGAAIDNRTGFEQDLERFHWAAAESQPAMIRMVLEYGAKVNEPPR